MSAPFCSQADCGLWNRQTGLFYDYLCTEPACPVCEMTGPHVRLMLRGLCSHISADRFYYLAASQTEILGHLNTKLVFSASWERWELVEMRDGRDLLAFMLETDGNKNFPLGLQTWQFLGLNCSDPASNLTTRSLSLHLDLEQPGHFCCDDGSCIDSELVYDEFLDCPDSSDEENITFILLPDTYSKLWPPVNFVKGHKELFDIYMKFTVVDIFDINEEEAYFDISFLLHMRWYDHELTFLFLKNNFESNYLYEERLDEIWYPKVYFENTLKEIENLGYTAFVSKESSPLLVGDMDEIHASEQYPGSGNAVNLLVKMRSRFSCAFDKIRNYPFGTQECSLKIFLRGAANNLTRIRAEPLVDKGPPDFGQYLVGNWRVASIQEFGINRNKIQVTTVLRRDSTSIFLGKY